MPGDTVSDCLFCKFAKKELEKELIYEDEDVIAFLDINPAGTLEGHSIVLPKKHFDNFLDADEKTAVAVIKALKKIVPAVKEASGAQGINLLQNNGKAAAQAINHFHFHIFPRAQGDGIWFNENRRKMKPMEEHEVVKAIREALAKQK